MLRSATSSWAVLDRKEARWSPQSWRNGKNDSWWQQHLILEAGTIGSPRSEAASYSVYTASSHAAAPSPDLLPSRTGIGLGLQWTPSTNWGGRGAEGYRLADISHFGAATCTGQRHLGVRVTAVDVTVQDVVTHVLGQVTGFVDDMTTGKLALFKRLDFALPCVQAGLVPLSSVVLPSVRSLLEDDATSPLLQRDCTDQSEGRLAFDAWLPRLYGRFLGDLLA